MERSVLVVAATLAVGVAVGPSLVGIARRSATRVPGWWRAAGAPVGELIAVTVLSGGSFGTFALRYWESATLPAWCWLAATGIALTVIDLRHRRLPHGLTAAMALGGALLLAVAAAVEDRWPQLVSAILAGLGVFAVAAMVQLAFPCHTGGGDTALYGALAVFLGWFGWSGLFRGLLFASGLTAAVAISVWAVRDRRTAFPAGPTLIAGTVIAVLSV